MAAWRKDCETPLAWVSLDEEDNEPLRFLDYLIHQTIDAVVPHGAGVLVSVPPPERYACHKLIVAQRRSGSHKRDKAAKDIA